VLDGGVRETYQSLREGDYDASPLLLSYGCLFIDSSALRTAEGGAATADLTGSRQIILTGGASQTWPRNCRTVVELFVRRTAVSRDTHRPGYQMWVDGITWSGHASI